MNLYPIPSGDPDFAAAQQALADMTARAAVIDGHVAQEAALQHGYQASLGGQLTSFMAGKQKAAVAAARKRDNAITAAVTAPIAGVVQGLAATDYQVAGSLGAYSGGGKSVATGQSYTPVATATDSLSSGLTTVVGAHGNDTTTVTGQTTVTGGLGNDTTTVTHETVIGSLGNDTITTVAPPSCATAAFPVHTMAQGAAGGQWYMVCDHEKCVGAYGTIALQYDFACWRVYGPFTSASDIYYTWIQWQPNYEFGGTPPDISQTGINTSSQPSCPPGTYWNGVMCVPVVQQTQQQQQVTSLGNIVTTSQPPPQCPPGQVWNGTKCVPVTQQTQAEPCPPPCPPDPFSADEDAAAAAYDDAARRIDVAGWVDEIKKGKLPGGCTPSQAAILPFAGDPQFCQKMELIRDWLNKIGTTILVTDLGGFAVADDDDSPEGWTLRLLNWVVKYGGVTVRYLIRALWEGRRWLSNCDWCPVFALDLIEWLVSALRSIRFGVSIVAKLEATLGLDESRTRALFKMIRNYLCPDKTWSLGMVIAADNNGAAWDAATRDCVYRAQGADVKRWAPLIAGAGKHASLEQHVMYARLTHITPGIPADVLRNYGMRNEYDLAVWGALYDRPPTPHECLAWGSNAVTVPGFADNYSLNDEFDERLWNPYHEPLWAQGITVEVARQQWAHAQRLPGHGELVDAVRRQRPGAVDPSVQFSADDFRAHLAAQGYPPYWRERLYQLSDRPLGVGEAIELFGWYQTDLQTVQSVLLDHGTPGEMVAGYLNAILYGMRDRRAHRIGGYTIPELTRLHGLGVIDDALYVQKAAYLGIPTVDLTESQEAWNVGQLAIVPQEFARRGVTMPADAVLIGLRAGTTSAADAVSQLVTVGVHIANAQAVVSSVVFEGQVARQRQAEMMLRRAFIRGRLDEATAAARLAGMGFTQEHIAATLPLWQLDQTLGPKQPSEGAIIKWYKDGLITHPTAFQRLRNLGWTAQDANLRLAQVAVEAQPKARLPRKKAPADEPGAARLAKADAKNLYVDGVIDDGTAAHILGAIGYDGGAIALLLSDWQPARDKKAGKTGGGKESPPAPTP